ncbi:MAG: hypothetical protein ACI94Y_001972 [Maribacter sp.]|jgi:hypothetical protein
MKNLILVFFVSLSFIANSFAQKVHDDAWTAAEKIGQEVEISCEIVSTYYAPKSDGQPFFLNIDVDFPENPITIIIPRKYILNFPVQSLQNKKVIIKGLVKGNRNGKPTIFLKDERQLIIVEDVLMK